MGTDEIDTDKRATLRRFAAAGAAVSMGLAGTAAGETDSDARDAIAGYVTQTPGVHFSKIRDDLGLGTGETQHHLRRLIDAGILTSHKDGEYRRYFRAGEFDSFEQVVLSRLRRETPRQMLIALLREPDQSGTTLAAEIGVSRSTISTHATGLQEVGLLERTAEGYRVQQPTTVSTLLIRFAESFGEQAVTFAQTAADLLHYEPS